jgi:hypothetical protein
MEELKPTLAKYRSVPELGKAYHSLQKLMGAKANAITPLNEKSTPEEVAAYRKVMGVPDKPEDYKLKPADLPEGLEWSSAIESKYAEIAHKHHIPAAAMRELANTQMVIDQQRMQEALASAKGNLDAGVAALKDEWKGNYGKNIEMGVRVAKTVGLDVNSPGLTDPNVVRALVRMGQMLSEDKIVSGEFSPTANPGKARSDSIIKGNDPALLHLHKRYVDGDPEVVAMVRDGITHG